MASNDPVTAIEAALERNPDINLHQFPVEVSHDSRNDAIRLEGTVEDIIALRKIMELAKAEAGTARLVEDLHIQTSVDVTDDQLQDKVVETLSGERLFRDVRIGSGSEGAPASTAPEADWIVVSASGSSVHLEGRVHSLSHRRLAEALTWWIPGTSRIENRIQLEPAEEDSDDELSDAIGLVLERDPSLDASQIQVTVKDKAVVLEGGVTSDVNRTIAARDCWMVPGVHCVENRIQVLG
ncbi:Osmotically-inducible protein OsmY, contains BON domain [Marinobacter daqiaonensis]|uniref:Osmotically-inducible protein OsmY, contains BON domain n=1 Tax=Marinobacter daqiaonensis TaxID=650891 RepID=A0A1I6HGV3_9GAMM|nr:BON domain-containing protein [Marinobacter daqiaonensis]SFR53659.1 Osmotically-inducible protein OsmY, contains BON domain [Marinobacter daqiaonensis]